MTNIPAKQSTVVSSRKLHRLNDSPFQSEIRSDFLKTTVTTKILNALFCLNLNSFLVIVLCYLSLSIQGASIYILLSYAIVGTNLAQKFLLVRFNKNAESSVLSEVLDDASFWMVFAVNYALDSPISPIVLISLVIVGVFACSTISNKLFSHFLFSKLVLFAVCMVYARYYGSEITASIRVIAPLIGAFVLLFAAGYWYYIRHVHFLHSKFLEDDLKDQLSKKSIELSQEHKLRERLIRHVGHDLRQPVNALNYALFNMAAMNSDEKMADQLKLAQQSIDSANHLIEEITHVAIYKNKEGIDPKFEQLHCNDLLSELEREYAYPALEARCDLKVISSTASIVSDKQITMRILRNFVSNAIRYAAGQKILLGVRRMKDGIQFHLLDQGPGIPEDQLDHIFDEFSQGHQKTDLGGFGLGLNISRTLASAIQAEVSVFSTFGKGTHCVLSVPYR